LPDRIPKFFVRKFTRTISKIYQVNATKVPNKMTKKIPDKMSEEKPVVLYKAVAEI
jgi:hypothetical protein